MNLTKLIVRRPVAAVIIIFALVVFGVLSIFSFPLELTPELEMPRLIVSTILPGAAPEDVEKLVTRKVENTVGSLSGIKTVSSQSRENVSVVILAYEYGTNMDVAYTDLKEQLDGIANDLPDNAYTPIIQEFSISSANTITLSATSDAQDDLRYTVEEEIVPEFEKLLSVASVEVAGGREEYIRVELLEAEMQQYGIGMDTIISSVSTADFSIPGGSAQYASQDMAVRSVVEFQSVEALRNIAIPLQSGSFIRLSDVANVYEATKDAESISRFNQQDSIRLTAQKRQSYSTVQMSKEITSVMEELSAKYPDISIDVIRDRSEMIVDSIVSVGSTLVLGILLSMGVLYFFLGDIKASLIVGSSMPISLLVTFILMNLLGFSLNVVTLGALVVGVGMMVDNSIVVLDSCFKCSTHERTFQEAALEGTKFVMLSIAASTATTVVVFFPLALLKGMTGQLFGPLGFTIIFSLSASLVSAITLVPLFFSRFKPQEKRTAPAAMMLKKLEHVYCRTLRKLLKKKKTVVSVSIILLVAAFVCAAQLNIELMPALDEGAFEVEVSARPGIRLERLDEMLVDLENIVEGYPDVDKYALTASGNTAKMSVYLKENRKLSTEQAVQQFRQDTRDLIEFDIHIEMVSSTGLSSSNEVEINLKSTDMESLAVTVREVQTLMEQSPDLIRVSSTIANGSPQTKVVVDPVRAAAGGFTPMLVAANINTALSGKETVNIQMDNKEFAIWVEYPENRYKTIDDLSALMLVSQAGKTVPLTEIAELVYMEGPTTVFREDNQYLATITGIPTTQAKYTAEKTILPQVKAMSFQKGVTLADGSSNNMMTEEFSSLGGAIGIAVLLVFMVMAIQFESIKYSLMVMICLPFSLIGSFLLLFLTGNTINLVSLMGFLVLVGTVVNNGILFVDTTNQYRETMDIHKALITTGRHRLRPILMTTLTTVLSMVPMALAMGSGDDLMQGLALVVIGGLTASTILTLLLLPTFYLMFAKKETEVEADLVTPENM